MVVLVIIMIMITLNCHWFSSNMNKLEGQNIQNMDCGFVHVVIKSLDKSFLVKEELLEKEFRSEVEGGEISSKQPKPEMRPQVQTPDLVLEGNFVGIIGKQYSNFRKIMQFQLLWT